MSTTTLPPDDHTHTEFSWDAWKGSMLGSCARAVELGLPSIAFTEHVDWSRWRVPVDLRDRAVEAGRDLADDDGRFAPPPFDVEGYLASVADCREQFPDLRIVSGVEVGEPHLFGAEVAALLNGGAFERVLGSLHVLTVEDTPRLVDTLFDDRPEDLTTHEVFASYLREATVMVKDLPDEVQVLAHIDYPARRWEGPFDPTWLEAEFREVLTALAATERALEINTRVPLAPAILGWWRDVGGRAVSFGSDAHLPSAVAAGFDEAAAMADAHGFRPDRHPLGFWHR
jgi:histidinol-phosphatase (PHP family)